jgi:hypothetical protein
MIWMRDFTIQKYKELCLSLLDSGYKPMTLFSYLSERPPDKKVCILRHDVDRKPRNALMMAELEDRMGIRSTYYFRYPYTFNPEIIHDISRFGHEIGYHYETLSKAGGDHEKAIRIFEKELAEFRKIVEVNTVCMHGSPLSRHDNRDLWKKYDFRDFGIEGETYLSLTGKGVRYLTDTGRSWNGRHSIRDMMPGVGPASISVDTTADLIHFIASSEGERLYLTVHPERWAKSADEWAISYVKDLIMNAGKSILIRIR